MQVGHPALSPLSPAIRSPRAWGDTVNQRFLPLEHYPATRDAPGFSAHIDTVERLAGQRLAMVQCPAHRVARTRKLAEQSDEGFFKSFWLLQGHCAVEQGGNRTILKPGDWTIYDTARPYNIDFPDTGQFLVLLLPHTVCQEWRHFSEQLCGRALTSDACARGALYALASLFGAPTTTTADEGRAVLEAATRLLSASLLGQASRIDDFSRSERRLQEARRYVLHHLSDAALSPDRLAQVLNMSRRALYVLFNSIGATPANFILEARLEACRHALADPARRPHTITNIALDFGFCDSAHFSRLFKQRYGMTPRQWRDHA